MLVSWTDTENTADRPTYLLSYNISVTGAAILLTTNSITVPSDGVSTMFSEMIEEELFASGGVTLDVEVIPCTTQDRGPPNQISLDITGGT